MSFPAPADTDEGQSRSATPPSAEELAAWHATAGKMLRDVLRTGTALFGSSVELDVACEAPCLGCGEPTRFVLVSGERLRMCSVCLTGVGDR